MKTLIKIFVIALLLRIFLSFTAIHTDTRVNMDWGTRFFEYGPSGFYGPQANVWNYTWPNQPPGTIYIFAAVRKLYEITFSILWWINTNIPAFPSKLMFFVENHLYQSMIKLPGIIADIGIAWLIYILVKNKSSQKTALLGAIFFLFNPVIWYNSAVWGQTDATVNFFGLLAFYFLTKKHLSWAILAMAISLYIKISLLIFAPIFALLVLKQKHSAKKIALSILPALFLVGSLTLPFSNGEPFSWLYWLYSKKVLSQQLQVTVANAFNFWAALKGLEQEPHTNTFILFSYQTWGFLLFTAAFIPTLFLTWKRKSKNALWWGLALTALASFTFLTNMHERYLYPFFPFFTILAVKNKKLIPIFVMISLINLINLYNFWWTPRVESFIALLTLGNKLLPRLLSLVNLFLFVLTYKLYLTKKS